MPLGLAPRPLKPLTWREILDRLPDDPEYPSGRRAFDVSRIKKALAWDAAPTFEKARSPIKQPSKFLDCPFNYRSIDQLFDGLRAAELRLTPKTLENARSICKFASDFYGVARGVGHTPFSDDCDRLLSMVPSKWDRRALRPGMHYLSYALINPWEMSQSHVQDFGNSLYTAFQVARPRELFNEFTRVWNKCAATISGWPTLIIARNVTLKKRAIEWCEHPELKLAIEQYLARGRRFDELELDETTDEDDAADDHDVVVPLAADTAQGHRSSLGMVVWALRTGGILPDELVTLRDLCAPERYRLAMRELTARAGGVVNRTVHARLAALGRLAETPGVLKEVELKMVRRIRAKYEQRFRVFLQTYEERDQKTLDQLDDPSVMDALLALPTLTKNQVLAKRNRHTVGCAYAIQRALILELWMCAPYRIGA